MPSNSIGIAFYNYAKSASMQVSDHDPLPVAIVSGGGGGGTTTVDFPENQDVTVTNFPSNQPVTVSNFPASPSNQTVTVSNSVLPVNDNGGSLTVDGTVGISGTVTVASAAPSATAGSLLSFRNIAVLAAATTVKAGAGRVYGYHIANPNASWVYLNFYNALIANVTPGTTVPTVSLGVPPNTVLDGYWNVSYAFSTGVAITVTTTPNGGTAPSTGAMVQLSYV